MKARLVAISKRMEWKDRHGSGCRLPSLSFREDLDIEAECPDNAEDAFKTFASANKGMSGSFKRGNALIAFMSEESKSLGSIMGILPRQAKWTVSSALAEGRIVELRCYQLDVD